MFVTIRVLFLGCLVSLLGIASAQTLSLDKASYESNESLAASFTNGSRTPTATDWIGVYPQGVTPSSDLFASTWEYTNVADPGLTGNGTLGLALTGLAAGNYSAWFLASDGYNQLAGPINFSITNPAPAGAQLTLDKSTYEVGEDILATFSNGPGNSTDWVAIYSRGVIPSGSPASILWAYANVADPGLTGNGVHTFSSASLAVGSYSAWFLANDGYGQLAGPIDFDVVEQNIDNIPPSWVTDSFKRRHAVTGAAYSGKISAYTELPGYTFSKAAGPAWLSVSASGALSGTPGAADVGLNTFTVSASNATDTAQAEMSIEVFASGTEEVRVLKVLSYNAWHGFGSINGGHRKGLESIILSDADIIGMQESLDNVSGSGVYQPQKIANDLGWFYRTDLSTSLGIISRYPITDQTLQAGIARGAKIQITANPEQEVILMNCHLDYLSYGPYAAEANGANEAKVLAEETASQRDEQIAAIVAGMSSILSNADNIPVLLTGDFNAPSHLDWTDANAAAHYNVGDVAWPTSTAVINAGMSDSFREIHPDPTVLGGNTWSPVFKGTEPQDRIDFVYFKGSSMRPLTSEVFTTAVENTTGRWGASTAPILNNTWPSDHAAVLTEFSLAVVDADEDGLSDAYENRFFGSVATETGSEDADSDGSTNRAEQLMGTDPLDAQSRPVQSMVMPADPASPPQIQMSLTASALASGVVCERSADLENWDTVWSFQADPLLQSSQIQVSEIGPGHWAISIEDSAVMSLTGDRFFYRVREGN